MTLAFRGCSNLTVLTTTDTPDLSNLNAINYMFDGCLSFNSPINNWDVSNVTNMESAFNDAFVFNQDLDLWDVSNVVSMTQMFQNAKVFNGNITTWNVGNVLSFSNFLNNWRVNSGTFNQDLSSWDVSSATNMAGMFSYQSSFNQDITSWNVSSVTNMSIMFSFSGFNQPIGIWNVSNVTDINQMFEKSAFDQSLSAWNTSNVTNMARIFRNVSKVRNNIEISGWTVSQVTNLLLFATGTTLSTPNYDALLIAWDAQGAMSFSGIVPFGSSKYTLGGAAEAARTSLIAKWGGITDGGAAPVPFTLRIDTTLGDGFPNMSLPMISGNYDVDWGDGNVDNGQAGSQTHTYATGGVYDIRVTGGTYLQYNFGADILKVTNLLQWGSSAWIGAYGMFGGCQNMVITATDIPDFSNSTNFQRMLRRTTFTNVPNIDQWDVSNATILSEVFYETACDPNISSWQITQVVGFNNFAQFPSAFTTSNYDNILIAWEAQNPTNNVVISFGNTQYTSGGAAEAARTSLINSGWTITDGGAVPVPVPVPVPYTTNLVASYSFDTDFSDYTGNNPLTANGNATAGVTGGKVSDCAELDGSDDYTVAADSSDFSFTNNANDLPFSFSFWANFDTVPGLNALVVPFSKTTYEGIEYIFSYVNGELYMNLYSQSLQNVSISAKFSFLPVVGDWNHIVITYDGSSVFSGIKPYINSVSIPTTSNNEGSYLYMVDTPSSLNIGSQGWIPTEGEFDGKLDEFHIWKNRELTQSEVTDIYNTENAGNSILP